MTVRKLDSTNPIDMLKATFYAYCVESAHTETRALNPHKYAGYTAATMIPDLNEAVEKAAQGDPDPESDLIFEISDYPGASHLALIELFGYVVTDPGRNQGFWTGMRVYLGSNHHGGQ